MSRMDIDELERRLAGDADDPGRPDLSAIHRLGRRRRKLRTVAVGGVSVLAIASVVAGGLALRPGDGEPQVASDPPVSRTGLTDLGARALAEIPGAEQVSPTDVVIPAPDAKQEMRSQSIEVQGRPVELPEHAYAGVTMYPSSAFPAWLYDGTEEAEHAAGDANGYPVGSTDVTGVLVDVGPRYLGCALPRDDWGAKPGAGCFPAVLSKDGGTWRYEWGMGTDAFLKPGSPMEVFDSHGHLDGQDSTLSIAGIDGTDVARADFIATDGTVVEGTVEAGTLVPGDSMFFGEVPGDLAEVVVYDASGAVIEDHRLKDCDTPVDCEVR